MFRSRISWAALLLCLPSVFCFAAPKPQDENAAPQKEAALKETNLTVAIADFDGNDKELTHFLAETLLTTLQQSDKLTLVDRSALRAAFAELKLQSTGLVEPQQVKKIGRLVSADHLIVGSFLVRDGSLTINARLLDVKTGKLAPGGAASVSGSRKDFLSLTTQLARKFHRRVTGEELLADSEPVAPPTPRLAVGATVPDIPIGNLLTYYQGKGLIPADALPESAVMEGDLARLVSRVARSLSAPNEYRLSTAQPTLPVTRIRVLAALVKLAEAPENIAAFRSDPSRPRPIDGDAAPMWGLPYLAAALSEGWLRADETFKPRNAANWTFVSALLARLPVNGPFSSPVSGPVVASNPAPRREIHAAQISRDAEEFSGLIVDARDFDTQRGTSACIVDEQGAAVYPAADQKLDMDFLEEKGLVGYCETPDAATRAGAHPLIVSASDLSGASHCKIVVSNETAEKIRAAERKGKFFGRWAVCFLVNPPAQK